MKKLFTILSFFLFTSEIVYSQDTSKIHAVDTAYDYIDVEEKPVPEHGLEALYKSWNSLVNYPSEARQKNVEGKVFISFVVDESGKIMDPIVEQGLGYGCDEATINALLKTKLKWKPGTINGENVKVRMSLPFSFKLI
ncbi:MAG: energy transducer TonB [Bacteroidota bacterium]|nr:energy transducer TonB [Bacteroidota bacterium]